MPVALILLFESHSSQATGKKIRSENPQVEKHRKLASRDCGNTKPSRETQRAALLTDFRLDALICLYGRRPWWGILP